MRHIRRTVSYSDQPFRFERLGPADQHLQTTWAASRGGEFIGTMNCPGDISTNEFDVRCQTWLCQLLGAAKATNRAQNTP
jgi:hypothetical protein